MDLMVASWTTIESFMGLDMVRRLYNTMLTIPELSVYWKTIINTAGTEEAA